MRLLFVFIVSIAFLSGCASFSLDDVYQPPTFRYVDTNIQDVTFSQLEGQSVIQVRNANPYGLPVNQIKAELWLEGKPWLALDNSALSRGLPANQSISVSLNWALVFDELLQRAGGVYEKGEADFTLRLQPTLNVPVLGPQTLTWSSDFTVPVPKLPKISLSSWSVDSVSFSEVKLAMSFQVENPNAFGIDTQGLGLNIKQNGRTLSRLSLNDTSIKAGQQSTQRATIALSIADVGLSLARALQQGKWPNEFDMTWQGDWRSPDLDFALPSLAGNVLND